LPGQRSAIAAALGSARIPTTARAICATSPARPSGSSGTKNTAKTSATAEKKIFSCRRSAPRDRRARTMTEASEPAAATKNRRSAVNSIVSAMLFAPGIPSGFAPADGTSSSTGPGRIAIEIVASATDAPATAPTSHQRFVGGRPVGKSSGTNVTTMTRHGTKSMSPTSDIS
jgi:hypothetical protein